MISQLSLCRAIQGSKRASSNKHTVGFVQPVVWEIGVLGLYFSAVLKPLLVALAMLLLAQDSVIIAF